MRRFIKYIKIWNIWRKGSTNDGWHKLLVLFKLKYSPTFEVKLLLSDSFLNDSKMREKYNGDTTL